MNLYLHCSVGESNSIVSTIKLNVNPDSSITSAFKLIESAYNNQSSIIYSCVSLCKSKNFMPLKDLPLKNYFEEDDDVFVKLKFESSKQNNNVESTSNTKTNENTNIINTEELVFKVLDKYYFYDDSNKFVKVHVAFKDIQNIIKKLDKSNILEEFKDSSFLIKLNNVEGKNYRFGVGRLHYKINPEECKVLYKNDEIVIKLKKLKEGEHWPYLHKTKMIGDDD